MAAAGPSRLSRRRLGELWIPGPGQALFDPSDPVSPIARAESPFLPGDESEGLQGQVDNV
jgi:hypothetical protein